MSEIAIRVENLGKCYLLGHNTAPAERYTALRDVIGRNARGLARKTRDMLAGRPIVQGEEVEEFWALRNVDFEVRQGERVGIIGRNGAGKSTLLKVLSRITEPSVGRVTIRGRVASLLEVGTGFHPELTGRENVFLNGAILGMGHREIQRKFDEIVDFAGVERFLDTPVKRYSSGMYVRLAFAVAAHLEPEILVVDEVLAVGDAQFQKKCISKMEDVSTSGRTILFVSHNMAAIRTLCTRAVLLESGALAGTGPIDQVVAEYISRSSLSRPRFEPDRSPLENDAARISGFSVSPGEPATGAPVQFTFEIESSHSRHVEVDLAVSISTPDSSRVLQIYSLDMGKRFFLGKGRRKISAAISALPLAPGDYIVNLWLGSGSTPIDWKKNCFAFTVQPGMYDGGSYVSNTGYPVVVPSIWTPMIDDRETSDEKLS